MEIDYELLKKSTPTRNGCTDIVIHTFTWHTKGQTQTQTNTRNIGLPLVFRNLLTSEDTVAVKNNPAAMVYVLSRPTINA